MDIFQSLIVLLIVVAELTIIICLYNVIRTDYVLLAMFFLVVDGLVLFGLKTAFDFGANLTDTSKNFLKLWSILELPQEDRLMMAVASQPLRVIVGNTFKITRQTFPTVVQNIILDNVVTLLVTY